MSRTPLRRITRTRTPEGRIRVTVATLDDGLLESWEEEPDGLTHYVDARERKPLPANDG